MSLELSAAQLHALDATGTPLKLVDPRGGVYVLVPEAAFTRAQALLTDDLAETYPAQVASAMRAGWDDPQMDDYNDYDRHRAP